MNRDTTDDGNFPWTEHLPLAETRRSVNRTSIRKLHLSRAKLKASSRASALLSGFAMMAMIELTIENDEDNRVPEVLLVVFTAFASLLVVVHITALMISTCILPQLECYISVCESSDGFIDSPYEKVRGYIEMSWIFSTALGMLLFLVVVVLACWVKFWNISKWSAGVCFLIVGPVVVVFILFAIFFYRTLISFKYQHASKMVDSLDRWMSELEKGTYSPAQPHSTSLPTSPTLKRSQDVTFAEFFDFVVVGGGIAGVVCAETLCELIAPQFSGLSAAREPSSPRWRVCLVSASPTLKTVVNVHHVTRLLESFDVAERDSNDWSRAWPHILTVLIDKVAKVNCESRLVHLAGRPNRPLKYGRICMATGGVPRAIVPHHPLVLTLRDTESVTHFRSRLSSARRVVLVGNGGIATEVAYEIEGCQVIWVVKHENISVPFLDPAASQFLLKSGLAKRQGAIGEAASVGNGDEKSKTMPLIRTLRYALADRNTGGSALQLVPAHGDTQAEGANKSTGSALGPDWTQGQRFIGIIKEGTLNRPLKEIPKFLFSKILTVVYKCQVDQILSPSEFAESGDTAVESDAEGPLLPSLCPGSWPLYVRLSNGECYGADFVISATGVEANLISSTSTAFPIFTGGGVVVNEMMQSSVPEVYAAGDCAFAGWQPKAPHWFQMRLWSQARQTAFQAAKSMFYHTIGEEVPLDFSFEIFTHVTQFFGFKIVLLGLFNGQGLDLTSPEVYVLLRVTPGEEYVKCIMRNGRMQGALLIGETDLEETFENLILSQIDLSQFGEHLLDPNIDISDYFE
ncbi:Pyridine nucleotide-disulfide oxidoreductase domain-containing protein 1 [Taenia solium]|eukprot:TsM_000529800 transcript=TsM_000529800 gene=TsM_000529800